MKNLLKDGLNIMKRVMIENLEKIKKVIKQNKLGLEVVGFGDYRPFDNNDLYKMEEIANILPLELRDKKIDIVIFTVEKKVSNCFGDDVIPGDIKKIDMQEFLTLVLKPRLLSSLVLTFGGSNG